VSGVGTGADANLALITNSECLARASVVGVSNVGSVMVATTLPLVSEWLSLTASTSPLIPISPELRHNAFLAAKEAINNVVKHSGASSAWLRLQLEPARFILEISDDGKSVTFTFLDGTGMASRDVGHMDKVRINFEDDNHFKSQWTFYANGKEKWMEAITYERIVKPAAK